MLLGDRFRARVRLQRLEHHAFIFKSRDDLTDDTALHAIGPASRGNKKPFRALRQSPRPRVPAFPPWRPRPASLASSARVDPLRVDPRRPASSPDARSRAIIPTRRRPESTRRHRDRIMSCHVPHSSRGEASSTLDHDVRALRLESTGAHDDGTSRANPSPNPSRAFRRRRETRGRGRRHRHHPSRMNDVRFYPIHPSIHPSSSRVDATTSARRS